MRRTWHVIGTTSELAKDGDFITTDVAGVAVQVRNFGGSLRALSNVCSHRHCFDRLRRPVVTRRACNANINGWEFHADGQTGRIPEPKNFVPFERDKFRLASYQVATVGQLVFVNIDKERTVAGQFSGARFFSSFSTSVLAKVGKCRCAGSPTIQPTGKCRSKIR